MRRLSRSQIQEYQRKIQDPRWQRESTRRLCAKIASAVLSRMDPHPFPGGNANEIHREEPSGQYDDSPATFDIQELNELREAGFEVDDDISGGS